MSYTYSAMSENEPTEPQGKESTEPVPPVEEPKPIRGSPSEPAPHDDLTQVKKDLAETEKKMSGFEKSTLRWTRASFIVILFTGLFIALQWLEMRSGGKDTHDLAVAAGKQADATRDLATAAGKQSDATKALAELTAKQFAASQQLVESQRASIEVGFASVNNPITFHEGNLSIVFSVALRNVGRLTANKVKIRFTSYFSQWGETIFSEPMRRQRDFCNKTNTLRLRKDLRDLRGLTSDDALTILPGDTKERQINFGWASQPILKLLNGLQISRIKRKESSRSSLDALITNPGLCRKTTRLGLFLRSNEATQECRLLSLLEKTCAAKMLL
jgi:hypothetical protein